MELVIIYTFFIGGLGYSAYRDWRKTKKALIIAGKVLIKMFPALLLIIGLVGLLLGFVSPEIIEHYLGGEAGYWGTILAAAMGAIIFIPNIISMPLAGSLLRSGAAAMTVGAFITTLTMVGIVTLPLEIKEMGKRFTFWRNFLSFAFALLIALLIGLIFP